MQGEDISQALLDDRVISELSQRVGPKVLVNLLRDFVDEIAKYLNEMSESIRLGRIGELPQTVVSLKDTCRNYGATKLADRASEIEEMCKSRDLMQLDEQCKKMHEIAGETLYSLDCYSRRHFHLVLALDLDSLLRRARPSKIMGTTVSLR